MTRNDKIREINQKLIKYYHFNDRYLSVDEAKSLALKLNAISVIFIFSLYFSFRFNFWIPLVCLICVPSLGFIYKNIYLILKEPSSQKMIQQMEPFYIKDFIQSKEINGDVFEIVLKVPQDNLYICKNFEGKIVKLTENELKKSYILIV
jgi:hypothetical protein